MRAEAANVRVAKFTAVVEREKDVSVRLPPALRPDKRRAAPSFPNGLSREGMAAIAARGLGILEHQKFSVSSN